MQNVFWLLGLLTCNLAITAQPLRLHPENPHYFLFRGKPAILITSGEHYGAVLNGDFDYLRYLEELKAHNFNHTRTFSGTYREVPGSFNIKGNTLAPASTSFLCPWARRGDKFDLTRWDENYFKRLKAFVGAANEHGIVVELVFFCTMYDEGLWKASPMNAANNVNGIGTCGRAEVYNGKDKALLEVQTSVVRKIVTEMNGFDNLYYEVCNEPYERGGLGEEWNEAIIAAIVEAEKSLPKKHLIAQGIPHASRPIEKLNANVSVLNFHAAKPEFVRLNYGLNKVIADDETGGSDQSDRRYRREAWEFMLAGGGVFSHLDFSFTTEHPDGSAVPLPEGTPGGGGPELRRQLAVMKRFMEELDLVRMRPEHDGATTVLAQAGKVYVAYYAKGPRSELKVDLPMGWYKAEWLDPKSGKTVHVESFRHENGAKALGSPEYKEDILIRLSLTSP